MLITMKSFIFEYAFKTNPSRGNTCFSSHVIEETKLHCLGGEMKGRTPPDQIQVAKGIGKSPTSLGHRFPK